MLMCLYMYKDCKGLGRLDMADAGNAELEFEHQWEHKLSQHLKSEIKAWVFSTENN